MGRFLWSLVMGLAVSSAVSAHDLDAMREDQFNRLKNYAVDAILPSGLVRDSLVLDPSFSSYHPATPDAAGVNLYALSALDYLGKLPDAEERVIRILSAYAGLAPGVVPDRSADGFYTHFMDVGTGAHAGGGWDASYSPIGTALLVAGAQFASNHFAGNATIAALADQLTGSVKFNNAISPALDGGIFLDMTKAGGGTGGLSGEVVRPFNEYMLVVSLALREADNARAVAVKHLWFGDEHLLKKSYGPHRVLTDQLAKHAPAFWVQDMHFFNADFRHNPELEAYFTQQQQADKLYSMLSLGQLFRYGLTAGVVPDGYNADRIGEHPAKVFSPEAVAAWGDMGTLLRFYKQQNPASDPRYRYGMVRVSAEQPEWIPADAGLVDHMFLLFGLVESLHPTFFTDRMTPRLVPGNIIADGEGIKLAAAADQKPTIVAANEQKPDVGTTNVDAAAHAVSRPSILASVAVLAGVQASAVRAFFVSLLSSVFLVRGRRLPV
jgi:hypothetical protein